MSVTKKSNTASPDLGHDHVLNGLGAVERVVRVVGGVFRYGATAAPVALKDPRF